MKKLFILLILGLVCIAGSASAPKDVSAAPNGHCSPGISHPCDIWYTGSIISNNFSYETSGFAPRDWAAVWFGTCLTQGQINAGFRYRIIAIATNGSWIFNDTSGPGEYCGHSWSGHLGYAKMVCKLTGPWGITLTNKRCEWASV